MEHRDTTKADRPRVDVDVRDLAIVAAPVVAGGVVGALTAGAIRGWYRTLEKPAWNPPDRIFGPVWTTLYLLMGVAAALVARDGRRRSPRREATGGRSDACTELPPPSRFAAQCPPDAMRLFSTHTLGTNRRSEQ